jgi:hypothetical protein
MAFVPSDEFVLLDSGERMRARSFQVGVPGASKSSDVDNSR